MASVTNKPIRIGGAGGNLRVFPGSGPWLYNSNLYAVLHGPTGIYVCQSTDDGATWAELDSADKPADSGGEVYADMHSAGSVIEIAYRDSSFQARSIQFNLATSQYANDIEVPHGAKYSVVAVRSNGDKFIANGGTAEPTHWGVYNGATWDTDSNVISDHIAIDPATETTRPYCATVDADDTVHLIYGKLTVTDVREFFHRSISPSNVVSDPTTVGSSSLDDATSVQLLGDKIIVSSITLIASLPVPAIFIGDSKTSPAWHKNTSARTPRKPFRSTGTLNAGSFYYFTSHREDLTNVEQIGVRPFDGINWGGELNWYDANTNAPNISSPPDPQLLAELSVRVHDDVFHCVITMRESASASTAFYMSDSSTYVGGGPGEPPPAPDPDPDPPPSGGDEDPEDPLAPGVSPTQPTPAAAVPCYTVKRKHASEVIPVIVDAADWLEDGDSIDSASWSAEAGITVDGNWHDDTKAVAQVSGGTDGTDYVVVAQITTTAGRTEVKNITVRVEDCS